MTGARGDRRRAGAGRLLSLGVVSILSLAALAAAPGSVPLAPPGPVQRPDGLYARIVTNRGVIVARLEYEKTPLAVTSFVGLAEGTIANEAFEAGERYYDGSVFHRVVEGHVIQAGAPSPDRSEARGPGFTYPNEIHADSSHDHAGALGVANGGPGTNGAQFYITLGDRSYLDGDYIVFGEVTEGMDVVHAIEQGDLIETIEIERVGTGAEAFRADSAGFEQLVAAAEERAENDLQDRARLEREWIRLHFPEAGLAGGGIQRFPQELGRPGLVAEGDRLAVRYAGIALRYRGHMLGLQGPVFEEVQFASSAEGRPQNVDLEGEVFEYVVGESSITRGFDAAIAEMRRGGKDIVVVPFHMAYGRRGFYGPDRPNRLVISPNTMVIYAIEILDQ